MRPTKLRLAGRSVVAALVALLPVVTTSAEPALAATRAFTYQCLGSTPLGLVNGFAYQDVLSTSAPASVPAGQNMTIVVNPRRNQMPSAIDDRPVVFTSGITLKLPMPTNSTFVSASLSGGFGTGPVTVTPASPYLVFSIPGPIVGGATFQLPTLTLTVTAGPASSGPVIFKLDGFTMPNPALTFTARIQGSTITADVPTRCIPNPNAALTQTTVT
ncbi:hypothetical protein [Gandjariella thermophila]|uniref:Cyclase n=1 Tax=Gandjariella thermophila TaxID=1931992 RepID=A0A4D4JEV5_9PSEU|nr:hypothetical protein [Gandjariella thermophila]GDY33560.1 cyclase [Gandjariella thermophila]